MQENTSAFFATEYIYFIHRLQAQCMKLTQEQAFSAVVAAWIPPLQIGQLPWFCGCSPAAFLWKVLWPNYAFIIIDEYFLTQKFQEVLNSSEKNIFFATEYIFNICVIRNFKFKCLQQ